MAGLLLLFGCWEQAHQVSQEDDSKEGSYWHGIVHRLEPDNSNAAYWFNRVGTLGPGLKPLTQGSEEEFQQEWLKLFEWCAESVPAGGHRS